MQFSTITTFFLAGLAIASPLVEKRDTATVFTNLATVSSDIDVLTTDCNALTGTITQCLAIYTAIVALETAEGTTVTNTKAATWSAADSATAAASLDAITTKFISLLGSFNNKFTVLQTAGYAIFVGSFLKTVATDTDAFYAQFITSLTAKNADVSALKTKIDAAFAVTEAIYA